MFQIDVIEKSTMLMCQRLHCGHDDVTGRYQWSIFWGTWPSGTSHAHDLFEKFSHLTWSLSYRRAEIMDMKSLHWNKKRGESHIICVYFLK